MFNVRRKDETRQKIILGSFLIAQMNYNPALRNQLVPELEKYLNLSRSPSAKNNQELIQPLLDNWLK